MLPLSSLMINRVIQRGQQEVGMQMQRKMGNQAKMARQMSQISCLFLHFICLCIYLRVFSFALAKTPVSLTPTGLFTIWQFSHQGSFSQGPYGNSQVTVPLVSSHLHIFLVFLIFTKYPASLLAHKSIASLNRISKPYRPMIIP